MQGSYRPTSSFPHSHRRHNSGELDVFEAARYFSGSPESREVAAVPRSMRVDVPAEAELPKIDHYIMKKGKCKQSDSPRGRLARFLNSFFQQSSAKKNNKLSSSKSSKVEREENLRGVSIGQSRSSTCTTKSDSFYDHSCYWSGIMTPSHYDYNKRKAWDDKLMRREEEGVWSGEINILKEKNGCRSEKGKGEDGEESDSSSDLFELKDYNSSSDMIVV